MKRVADQVVSDFEDEQRLPSTGLLSFYDGLRSTAAARARHRLGDRGTDLLLLIPDVVMLIARLSCDRRTPSELRKLLAGSLAYFLLPFDLFPEALAGFAGFADDLVLAVAVLSHTFSRDLADLAADHWSGEQDVREVIGDVLGTAHLFLGERLFHRLLRVLRKRGVDLETEVGSSQ